MKLKSKFRCEMKKIIVYLSIILTSSLLYSQSIIVYDAGTSIDIGTSADICADAITVNGTFSGSGKFCDAPLAVEIEDIFEPPKEFNLSQNYPNPFNSSTVISYLLPVSAQITLKVYDVLGNEVAILVNEEKPAGMYEVGFNASQLSSGIYFYKLNAGSFVETKKMQLLN